MVFDFSRIRKAATSGSRTETRHDSQLQLHHFSAFVFSTLKVWPLCPMLNSGRLAAASSFSAGLWIHSRFECGLSLSHCHLSMGHRTVERLLQLQCNAMGIFSGGLRLRRLRSCIVALHLVAVAFHL